MVNTRRLVFVSIAWISILYVVCIGAVAIYPQIRPLFMKYALHAELDLGDPTTRLLTFVIGFIFWNIAVGLAFGLFSVLFNRIRI